MLGYDPVAQKQRSMALSQMNDYGMAKSRELDAEQRRHDSQSLIDSTAGMFLHGGLSEAPSSGYSDERGYTQGLADKRTIAETEGGGPLAYRGTYGGTSFAGARPSMAALRGSDDMGGYQPGDANRINSQVVAPTWEQQRQGRLINAGDARADAGIAAEDASNAADFDLGSGRVAGRRRDIGAIQDEEKRGDARLNSDIYFDPKVTAQRNDQFYQQMEQLRHRYTDPAMVRGQAEIAAAQTRGMFGLQRQDSTNAGNLAVQGARNEGSRYGADTRANASIGAAVAAAGGNPTPYRPGTAPGKTMSNQELSDFAESNGMTPQDAAALAKQHGYTIQ